MKELIIILYKIDVGNMPKIQAEQQISQLMEAYSFSKDEELKENYLIREIWLPIRSDSGGESDVKVIYPTSNSNADFNNLVVEVSKRIKESPNDTLKRHWNQIVRELKLKNLEVI